MTPTQATTAEQPAAQRRPGPPAGSTNAERHGARRLRDGMRFGLTCIPLPKGCHRIAASVNALRRHLEDAVKQARGTITATDAASINRAARWEALARVSARCVARECDSMTPETRRAYLHDVARGTVERDKAIVDLGLDDRRHASLWGCDGPEGFNQ